MASQMQVLTWQVRADLHGFGGAGGVHFRILAVGPALTSEEGAIGMPLDSGF